MQPEIMAAPNWATIKQRKKDLQGGALEMDESCDM